MKRLKNFIKNISVKALSRRIKGIIKSNQKLYNIYSKANLKIFKNFKAIEIETNPICNRRCSFCPITNDQSPLTTMMSEELFNKIVSELKALHFKGEVCLSSYGEPLLDKRLAELARIIKVELKPKLLYLFSNGDFLTPAKFRELLSAGVDRILLSQHDEEQPEAINSLLADLSPFERQHLVFEVIKEDSLLVNRCGTVEVKNLNNRFHCHLRKIYIRADGELRLCCDDYFREVKLGNVKEVKLIDIWNSPFYQKIRQELARGVFSQLVCRKCMGLYKAEMNRQN